MSKKLSKDDVKMDVVTQELQKGFVWATHHTQMVLIASATFLILGAGYSAYSYFDSKKEEQNQESYYLVERQYLDLKSKFEAAENPKKPEPAAAKDTKGKAKPAQPETPAAAKASGNLDKDYGSVVKEFLSVIEKAPTSKAAMMAGLNLADLYSDYNQSEAALKALEKLKTRQDLLSALVLNRRADLKADLNDCKGALPLWDDVLKNKKASFLAGEVKLKKGLCYEALNDIAQAKSMYTQAKEGADKSTVAKTAEKYLRLLETKSN